MYMGSLYHCIVAWHTLREWHRSQNCDNGSTTSTHYSSNEVWSCASQLWDKPTGAPTCDSVSSWQLYSATSLTHQAASIMTFYPTQLHYPDPKPNSPCPMLIKLRPRLGSDNVNFKVIGLTRPGLKNCEVQIRTCDLCALHIRPAQLSSWKWQVESIHSGGVPEFRGTVIHRHTLPASQ